MSNSQPVSLPEPSPPFLYFSPTLARLPKELWLKPLPACASCPASGWYTTTAELRCYCTGYGYTSWTRSTAAVTACDGRETALALLNGQENAGGTPVGQDR